MKEMIKRVFILEWTVSLRSSGLPQLNTFAFTVLFCCGNSFIAIKKLKTLTICIIKSLLEKRRRRICMAFLSITSRLELSTTQEVSDHTVVTYDPYLKTKHMRLHFPVPIILDYDFNRWTLTALKLTSHSSPDQEIKV